PSEPRSRMRPFPIRIPTAMRSSTVALSTHFGCINFFDFNGQYSSLVKLKEKARVALDEL
ncbi:MAG: hypothetical protein WCA28_21560, partial [Bradyrhizobium sp.]